MEAIFKKAMDMCDAHYMLLKQRVYKPRPLCRRLEKETNLWAYRSLKMYCHFRVKQLQCHSVPNQGREEFYKKIAKAHWLSFVVGFNQANIPLDNTIFHAILRDYNENYACK